MNLQPHITRSLENPTLQLALDRNAERRVAGRNMRFAELPNAEAVRDKGRAIRIDTLKHLDTHLEHFTANVEKNGGVVHWAQDAAEARAIILDLIRCQSSAVSRPLVVKSKSMVTEEIHLNHALEEAGIDAVETDLGEFIVQLRHETPAHIITPAVHLRREDVSELFQKEFAMPPTLDVETMTAIARKELRAKYFAADIGISGVNFGIAENGAICTVTNEGNGRLCTTVPRVHIAIMGLERLVPTMADLDIMLRLLPRSATAQKITSYINVVAGPRRADEPDGPEEVHIVLLDNGRSRTLGSELAESLLCIRCGACLNVCPVFREIGGHGYASPYSGPIGSIVSPALFGSEFNSLAHASSLCGACQDICPVRINIPDMLLTVRKDSVEEGQAPLWLRVGIFVYAQMMARAPLYELGQVVGGFFTRLLARDGRIRQLPPPLNAWTKRRDFPAFPQESFRARWKKRRPTTDG